MKQNRQENGLLPCYCKSRTGFERRLKWLWLNHSSWQGEQCNKNQVSNRSPSMNDVFRSTGPINYLSIILINSILIALMLLSVVVVEVAISVKQKHLVGCERSRPWILITTDLPGLTELICGVIIMWPSIIILFRSIGQVITLGNEKDALCLTGHKSFLK